jgi:hypothetical protein
VVGQVGGEVFAVVFAHAAFEVVDGGDRVAGVDTAVTVTQCSRGEARRTVQLNAAFQTCRCKSCTYSRRTLARVGQFGKPMGSRHCRRNSWAFHPAQLLSSVAGLG